MPRKDDVVALGAFRDVVWEKQDVLRGSPRGAPCRIDARGSGA